MKKYLVLMVSLLLVPSISQAGFYSTKKEKSVKVEKKKVTKKKIVKTKKTLAFPSIAKIGRQANKKSAKFSSKSKFARGDIVVVEFNKNYVYGKVVGAEKHANGRFTGFYHVKPSLVHPFMYMRMKAERIGKIK